MYLRYMWNQTQWICLSYFLRQKLEDKAGKKTNGKRLQSESNTNGFDKICKTNYISN